MGSSQQHNIQIVVTQQGLTEVESAMNNFANTSGLVAKSQDALSGAMGKTQGAALKTGQEMGNLSKEETKTEKTSMTLGQAIKGSALQITAFASGLVSTIGQFISYQKAGASLDKQHATLDGRINKLRQSQAALTAGIRNGSISTEEAAKLTEKYGLEQKKIDAITTVLNAKDQEHNLTLVNLASSILPTVINGIDGVVKIYTGLKGTIDVATASTDAGAESMDALGTAADTATTTGLIPTAKQIITMIPGVDRLAKAIGIGKNDGLTGAVAFNASQLAEHNKFSTQFVNAFKSMGAAVVTFASNIKTDMGNASGVIDKVKAGFSSFFGQLGTGFTGLGGHLKNLGGSIKAFGADLLKVFTANPILLVISAIAGAIIGLIFNVGGFRDRLNELGVTLGKMAPWAKPFLDVLGFIGEKFAQVGDWIMGTDHLASATTAAGQAARKSADDFDTHFKAVQKSFIISQDFAKFEGIVQNLKNVGIEIEKIKETTKSYGVVTKENLGVATDAFETFQAGVVKGVPEVDAKVKQIQATFEGMRQGTIKLTDGQAILATQLKELETLLIDNVNTSKTKIQADKESAIAMKGTSDAMTNAEKVIKGYNADIKASEGIFTQFVKGYTEGNYNIIEATGLSDEEITAMLEKFKKEFPNGAIVVKKFGEDVVVSLDTLKEQFGATSKDITTFVTGIEKEINPAIETMKTSFTNAQKAVFDYEQEQKLAIDVDRLATAGITQHSEYFVQAIDAIVKKYPELKLTAEKVRDAIVKAQEDQKTAREKENKEVDKQIEKAKSLGETRQEEIKANQALTTSAEALIKSLGRQVDVQGMTGEGLQKLIQIQDDTANSYGIAADNVGIWWAELKKSQAVEQSELQVLNDLAAKLGVDVPDALKTDAEGIKTLIQVTKQVGPAFKKMKDEALKALSEMTETGKSFLEGALSDKLGEDGDEIKKVLKGIDKMHLALTDVSTQEYLISIFLDDDKFGNDINNLQETMASTLHKLSGLSVSEANTAVTAWFDHINSEIGNKSPQTVQAMQQIWKDIAADPAIPKSGDAMVAELMKRLSDPSQIAKALGVGVTDPVVQGLTALAGKANILGQKISTEGAKGFESGGHLFATAGEKAMFDLLAPYGKAAQDAYAKSVAIADKTKEGIDTLPPKAQTALAPVEGVFSAAFIKASLAATGVLNSLFADIYKSMGFLVTNTTAQLAQIESAWIDHATKIGTPMENIKAQLLTLQETYSNLSLNIATYTTSMTTNIDNWLIKTTAGFGDYIKVIQLVQQTFSQLSLNIATYTTSITKNITDVWLNPTTNAYNLYIKKIQELQKTFETLTLAVKSDTTSMTTYIGNFATASATSFKKSGDAAFAAQGVMSKMSTSVATYMSSMTTHVNSFADACVKAFAKVGKAADDAAAKVKALQSAINALKDKTVTITTRYVTQGKPGARFGGSSIGYARGGDSWLQNKPGRIGGMNVGEFSKPELITVTPLSNPYDVNDKSINIPSSKVPSLDTSSQNNNMSARPVQITGDLYVTVQTQSGEVLAKQVKPYILSGFGGIT